MGDPVAKLIVRVLAAIGLTIGMVCLWVFELV